jgi:tetratricopeptide (TPR) repeat protein
VPFLLGIVPHRNGTMPSSSPHTNNDSKAGSRVGAILVFIATFIAHARSVQFGFSNFDDPAFVTEVDGYRGFSPAHLAWMFTEVRYGHWQPLTYFSYAIDHALWGMDPAGFHFTNILLHAVAAVLVMILTRQLLVRIGAAAPLLAGVLAALLFGLHPLRVESVAWITERRDVLSAVFLLSAAIFYIRSADPSSPEAPQRINGRAYALALLFLTLSLLSKAWGMTFFVVAMVLDLWPFHRLPINPLNLRRAHYFVLLQKLPLALLGVGAAVMAAMAQSQVPGTVRTLEQWGIVERVTQAAFGLVFYLWKTVWPTGLAALYELPSSISPAEPRFLASLVVLAALIVAVLILARRHPGIAAAGACYAVLVSPVLGLFQSGIQLAADRYTYLATIPIAMLLAVAGARLAISPGATRPRPIVLAVFSLVALTLAGLSWQQTGYWRTAEDTFNRVLAVGWDGPTTRMYLGRQLEERGDLAAALTHYRRAVELGPKDGDAWYALANALRASGDAADAERAYLTAAGLMLDPWQAYMGLGYIYLQQGRPGNAVPVLRLAVEDAEKPRGRGRPEPDGLPHMLLAAALDLSGDAAGSRAVLEKATQYPRVREEALRILRDMDEEAATAP